MTPFVIRASGLIRDSGLGLRASPSGLFDRQRVDRVALLDRVDDVLAAAHLAEDRVLAVEPVGRDVGDEELAAVGVRAGVGHAEAADLVLGLTGADLVGELVPRAAAAGAL